MTTWNEDAIQFPRLLAELRANGLTNNQYSVLAESMDLTRDNIDELLERAETAWQAIKNADLVDRLTAEYYASPAGQLPWVPPADESGYVEVPELSESLSAAMKVYDILAEKGDYRLVSDPECHWHIQCISTGAWYTEASGGWCDDSQTRGMYLELVAEHFPEFQEEENDNA